MEERGALVEELETLLDTVASAERDFSDTENERQDEIHAKIVDLDDSIQRAKNNDRAFFFKLVFDPNSVLVPAEVPSWNRPPKTIAPEFI